VLQSEGLDAWGRDWSIVRGPCISFTGTRFMGEAARGGPVRGVEMADMALGGNVPIRFNCNVVTR
jgi:hypothetical protein